MSKVVSASRYILLYVTATAIILFATGSSLWGQAQTATITGTATDPTGAAIVGAQIQATNTQTNVAHSTVTNAQGHYTIPFLPVGTYNVQASQSGFQTMNHKDVTLTVGSTVEVNFALPVGQISQTVNVEAGVTRVQTQTSDVSNLVAPVQVQQLPLNGRNIEQLLTLTPGVTAMAPTVNAVTGRMYGMQNNYSISGARPTGQMFLLDGTDVRDFWEHGIGSGYAGTELGIGSISQFQVITSNGNAQYAGNGIVSEVSRSGTNKYHGSVYEYFRNSALDARDINDPKSGPPPFRQNQFGVTLGGPIKHNKLFFFGNYEGLRRSLSTTFAGLPITKPYVANGQLPCYDIFGSLVANVAAPGAPPAPAAGCPTAAPAFPVAVGSAADPIVSVPGALPLTEQIIKLYGLCQKCVPYAQPATPLGGGTPIITAPGTDFGGYSYISTAPPLVTNEDYALGRIDYTIGPSDSVFGRYVIDDARVQDTRDPLMIFPEQDFTRNQYFTIAETHVVSPTMVNVIRFGVVRTNENSQTPLRLSQQQLSAVGLTADPLDFVATLYNEPFRPDGQFTPYNGAVLGPDPDRPDTLADNKFSGNDDVSLSHGAHSIKVGVVVTRVQVNNRQVAYAAGETYGFGSLLGTLQGASTFGFADPPGFADSDRYFREIDIAPYFQDDWRVTSRLTLNIGLRYDYTTNPVGWAGNNRSLTVLTGSFLPPVGPQAPLPTCPPNLLQAAICSLSIYSPVKNVFASNPNANNWQPRFGIAYSPFGNNKTAIRAGVGIFYDPTAARIYESGFIATPPAANFAIFGPSFPDAFNPAVACIPAITCPSPSEFAAVTYQNSNGSPYTLQYNFNVQQELAHGTILTVGYVGSVGRHLWNQRDINPPKCFTYPDCTALPEIPTAYPTASNGVFTVNTQNGNISDPSSCAVLTQLTCYGSGVRFGYATIFGIANSPVNRINPAFGEMVTEAATAASSYNSLQIGLNHQFSQSLSGQVNYTWSHCIDDGSFATSLEEFAQLQTNAYNQAYDYENCIFDVRHNLNVNGIYALPFKADRLVSGWQIATILGVHSGMPINIYNGSTIDPANLGTEWASRANYSFAPGCSPNHIIDKAVATGVIQWFDPSCYQPQAPGYFGNIRRNSVPGPGTLNLDLSIIKNTKITEALNLQFRAEAFNIMNHFNPGMPYLGGAIFAPTHQDGQVTTSQAPIVTPRQIQFALKLQF